MTSPAVVHSRLANERQPLLSCKPKPPTRGIMNKYAFALLAAGTVGLAVGGPDGGPVDVQIVEGAVPSNHLSPDDAVANEVVQQYCVRCHSERRRVGDLVLRASTSQDGRPAPAPPSGEDDSQAPGRMMPPSRPASEAEVTPNGDRARTAIGRDCSADHPGQAYLPALNRAEYNARVTSAVGRRCGREFISPARHQRRFDRSPTCNASATVRRTSARPADQPMPRIPRGKCRPPSIGSPA